MERTKTAETTPTVVPSGEGRHVGAPESGAPFPRIEIKLGAESGAGFSLVEYEVPGGFAPPPNLHRHTREDAVIYVLDGELRYVFADGAQVTAGPGTLVHLPAGAWFRWMNALDTPARMLCMFSPAGFEEFFAEVGAAVAAEGFDPAAMGRVVGPLRAKYGDEDR